MRRSSPLLLSPVITTGLTVVIAIILLAANFTIINAQQQVQSDGDLTATLNGETFARGDSITVRGTVAEREGGSVVYVNILDPDGIDLGTYSATVTNDLTFTYGFVAGQLMGMDKFGTYTIILTYFPPGTGSGIETTDVSFEYVSGTPTTGTTTNQPAPVQGTTTLFQSVNDSFSIQVPDGWIIHDLDNTGSAMLDEATQGYGILAQICPEDQEQGGGVPTLPNVGSSSSGDTQSCERSENDIIHIVRYHDLDTRLPATNNVTTTTSSSNNIMTSDNILLYQLQKLQEVGYRDIEILNSTDTAVNLTNPQTNETVATVPAKTVEMTYSSSFAPNETRSGSLISTATNATAPNLGMTKGYAIFYEGSDVSAAEPTIGVGSLRPLPPAVGQILDSFQLIAAPEVIAQAVAQSGQNGQTGQVGEAGQAGQCDPSYPDVCIASPPPNLNCENITARNFRVLPPDPHGFDGNDNDGIGCESGSNLPDDTEVEVPGGDTDCDPSYPDDCIPPPPPDLNCGDDGVPENFEVSGSDPHGFDGDNDGIGCESGSNQPEVEEEDEEEVEEEEGEAGDVDDGGDGGGDDGEEPAEEEPGDGGDGGGDAEEEAGGAEGDEGGATEEEAGEAGGAAA